MTTLYRHNSGSHYYALHYYSRTGWQQVGFGRSAERATANMRTLSEEEAESVIQLVTAGAYTAVENPSSLSENPSSLDRT